MVACTSFFFSLLCLRGCLSSDGGADFNKAAIAYNQKTRLTLSELEKQLFSRDFRLSLAKRPEKPLVKTQAILKIIMVSV